MIERISSYQLTLALVSMIIGIGIADLPKSVSQAVGNPDAWISVILGGIINIFLVLIICKLVTLFPDQTFFDYSKIITGKVIGFVLGLSLAFYWLFFAAFEVRVHTELLKHVLFDYTPSKIIYATFILTGVYILTGGLKPVFKVNELIIPLIFLLTIIIFSFTFLSFDSTNIRPVFGEGLTPIIKGLKTTIWPLAGFEALLAFGAFLKNKKEIYKVSVIAVTIGIIFYTLTTIITIGILSLPETTTLAWPTIDMIKNIELPGNFFEQFEIIFIVVWILKIFLTYLLCHYLACLGISKLLKINFNYVCYITAVILYIFASIPKNLKELFKIGDTLNYLTIAYTTIIPITLLILALIQKKFKEIRCTNE